MITKIIYECEQCHSHYDNKEDCLACEKRHTMEKYTYYKIRLSSKVISRESGLLRKVSEPNFVFNDNNCCIYVWAENDEKMMSVLRENLPAIFSKIDTILKDKVDNLNATIKDMQERIYTYTTQCEETKTWIGEIINK